MDAIVIDGLAYAVLAVLFLPINHDLSEDLIFSAWFCVCVTLTCILL